MERFYDLLFEVSNEYRHSILVLLRKDPLRVTDISRQMDLTSPEISRHVSRLGEVGLTYKDVDGFHHLGRYGELVLDLLEEIMFASKHSKYFQSRSLEGIPKEFLKRIGDLSKSSFTSNVIELIQRIEKLIQEAHTRIDFIADQFPMSSIGFIEEALDRGVSFRCIEPSKHSTIPRLFDDVQSDGLLRARTTPLVAQKVVDSVDLLMFVSESQLVISFPNESKEFDYHGFFAEDTIANHWAIQLFQHYWEKSSPQVPIDQVISDEIPEKTIHPLTDRDTVIVKGRNDPRVDPVAVQDAVDNYKEVILSGKFNFQTSTIFIKKSVHVKGDGRESDVPLTQVYKHGWDFPSAVVEPLFYIEGEEIEVTIENIHFTDFNGFCIMGNQGRKATIKDNRITLESGYYRGNSNIAFGDEIDAIMFLGKFPGGISIEGNYLDLATDPLYGGFHRFESMLGNDGKPDLLNHKYFASTAIYVRDAVGSVRILNNVLKNSTSNTIGVSGSDPNSEIDVKGNKITSDVYGSYIFDRRWSGYGIIARLDIREVKTGYNLKISDNTIELSKPHYGGIMISGPFYAQKESEKLTDGFIQNNQIMLQEGVAGILLESCDHFSISDNSISGSTYFGIGVFPRKVFSWSNMGANENEIKDNDMSKLMILPPDDYSQELFIHETYLESKAGTKTAHLWLNKNTRENRIYLQKDETVVDEGEDNIIQSRSDI